jgi:hypothetical protein
MVEMSREIKGGKASEFLDFSCKGSEGNAGHACSVDAQEDDGLCALAEIERDFSIWVVMFLYLD